MSKNARAAPLHVWLLTMALLMFFLCALLGAALFSNKFLAWLA